jgi:hypothetical protein
MFSLTRLIDQLKGQLGKISSKPTPGSDLTTSAVNVDYFALDDDALLRISRLTPSTPWGNELIKEAWPKIYPSLLSSDTYRGCATVLSALRAQAPKGTSLAVIERAIDAVDQSLKKSEIFVPDSDGCGGAVLTVTNAWQRTQSGLTADQLVDALESELIYSARMFMLAREREIAGQKLP